VRIHNMVNPLTAGRSVSITRNTSTICSVFFATLLSAEVFRASHIRSFRNVLTRFRRNRGGSDRGRVRTVAPMFFALLFAIIETALMFLPARSRDRDARIRAA